MVVFSLFIALILERLRITPDIWKLTAIAERWDRWLSEKDDVSGWREHDLFGPLLIVAPAILLALLLWINNSVLAAVLINIIVLTLVVGCRPQRAALRAYFLAAKRGDDEELQQHKDEIRYPANTELRVGQQLVWLNFRYYAAVALWFILLGAPGTLAYGLLRERAEAFPKLLAWVEWLPLRIAAFGYMLVGHFSRGLAAWLDILPKGIHEPEQQLASVAVAAEDIDVEEDEEVVEAEILVALARRNMILVLVVVAVLTLFGWVV